MASKLTIIYCITNISFELFILVISLIDVSAHKSIKLEWPYQQVLSFTNAYAATKPSLV